MRAVVFTEYGEPDVLQVGEVDEPHAGSGQVRVAVRAASINPIDVKVRSGMLAGGEPAEGTTVTGFDGAGVVDELGDGVTGVTVGDEVFGIGEGTHAEFAVLNAWAAKPAAMGWTEAGALGTITETAARGLTLLGVQAGHTVLVDGASGGVGKVAVQLAVARGGRVIGTASPARHDQVAALGAEPVAYGDGLADRVAALTSDADGANVDAVFDTAGKTPVATLTGLVTDPAQVVTIANFDVGDSGARLTGDTADTDPFAGLAEAAALYAEGRLAVHVDDVLTFEQAAEGQRLTGSGTHKVVLVP